MNSVYTKSIFTLFIHTHVQKPTREGFSASGAVCYLYGSSIRYYPSDRNSASLLSTSVETALAEYKREQAEADSVLKQLTAEQQQVGGGVRCFFVSLL